MTVRLGLDLGPNSIGWALIDEKRHEIIATGVRTFPEGLDNFDTGKEKSRNEQRRDARSMRRQILRRRRRKARLRTALIEAGLFPAELDQQQQLYEADPYQLRARALDEKLELFQIGRILLHLNQRRGFWSSRRDKAKAAEEQKRKRKPPAAKPKDQYTTSDMLTEITELEKAIRTAGCRTLGEYLHHKADALNHTQRTHDDHVRNRHTRRDMLADEFDAIWTVQCAYHPHVLTDQLGYGTLGKQKYPRKPIPAHDQRRKNLSDLQAFGLHGLIFFQRPIYWPRSVVGRCELEPRMPRCPRSHRLHQRARILQELNNIRYVDKNHHETMLSDQHRAKLLDHLATHKDITFDQIRKTLALPDTVHFNLERGKRSTIKGMTTDWLIAKKIRKDWHHRADEQKTEIVEKLLRPDADEDALIDQLVDQYHFARHDAEALVAVDLPPGFGNLSITAIRKLLPHLERGLPYMADHEQNSALHAAGYLRRDQLQRRIFDKLPLPGRVKDCAIGDIPNPVVKRALHQLRKLVNNIIREYGKPDAVHLEMARSVQLGAKRRAEYNQTTRNREKARNDAADQLRAAGQKVTRDAILRLILWEQQKRECLYCGQPISRTQLLTGDADIDHILPRSLSHDDAQSNKAVCHHRCNLQKAQQTPYQWLGETHPEKFEQICLRARALLRDRNIPYAKYQKILRKHVDSDQFLARQLVDTGYIARVTGEYLRLLFGKPHAVLGLKGQYTAQLRHLWGLDTVLEELPDSPAWQEKTKLRPGEKNRADHRHHAIDAIVLALTDRRTIQKLSRGGNALEDHPEGWRAFRQYVREKIAALNVCRQVQRGIRGKLHEDTFYGPVYDEETGERTDGLFVVRKPLADLTPNEVPAIRDNTVRRLVTNALAVQGFDAGRGKKPTTQQKKNMKQILAALRLPSGVPLKTVRLLKKDKTIQPIRKGRPDEAWVKPGNTHHLCLFEWDENGKTKRDAVFVTMLQAINRLKRKEPIIQRTPPPDHPNIPPDATFLTSLSAGEMVLADVKGQQKLLVFKTAASTQKHMHFALHSDARRSTQQKDYTFMPNTLHARKVTVDLLGRIRWASD